MSKQTRRLVSAVVLVMLLFSLIPVGITLAVDNLKLNVQHTDDLVTVKGTTTADTDVTLIVERTLDKVIKVADQTISDDQGSYEFSFALDGGDYEVTVTCNGLYKQQSIKIRDAYTKTVTVRVEGQDKTILPNTEVSILAGETTLLQAIFNALDSGKIKYELHEGLLDSIKGEEGWQWLVNNQGGMYLPTSILYGDEEILLIDDAIWDPVITRLRVEEDKIVEKDTFTAVLEQFYNNKFMPLPGKGVVFDREEKVTNIQGEVTFTAEHKGTYPIKAKLEDPFIRPVPLELKVQGTGGGGPGPDDEVTVSVKIKGYKHDVLSETVTTKVFSLDPYLHPGTGSSAEPSDGWDKDKFAGPTVAHATIEALKKDGFTRGEGRGHYDFQDYGWSCYFAMIDGDREKQYKSTSGWLYKVNGRMPGIGCQGYKIKNGDEIYWYFNINATSEVGGGKEKAGETTISGIDSAFQEAYDKLCNQEISEKEALEIVGEVVGKLQKKAKEIIKKEEVEQILKETKAVFKIINKAIEKIENYTSYEKMREKYRQVWGIGKIVADKFPEAERSKLIKQGALENLKQTAELLQKMPDSTSIVSLVEEALAGAVQMAETLTTQERREINEQTQNLVAKALEQIGTKVIPLNSIEKAEDTAIITVKREDLNYKLEDIIRESINLKEKIAAHNRQLFRELPLRLTIDATEGEAGIIQTKMTSDTLEQIFMRGIKEVQFRTQLGTVNLTEKALTSAKDKEQEIVLTMSKVNREELPSYRRAKIPQNSSIFALQITRGDTLITELQEPVKAVIPYNGKVNKGERITVYRLKNNGETEALGGIYDQESRTVSFLTESTGQFYVQEENKTFKDLQDCAWAQDVIESMAGKGLIAGRSEDEFAPGENITRAEFAALITRMLRITDGGEKVPLFTDVAEDKWYQNSVQQAYAHDLMKGKGENIFDPEGKITRQEIAAVIANVLQQQGFLPGNNTSLDNFTDKEQIGSWAQASVSLAAHHKIVAGKSDGSFAPREEATRAEAAVMLYRLYKLIMQ